MFDSKTKYNDIPQDAFTFNMQGECSFADGDKKENIRLMLYDGSVVPHWYWGNLAFDLSSMKLAKKKIPILADHNTAMRIGYSTGASFDDKFVLEGKFLDNDNANAIQKDATNGFPFEASLRFDPGKSKIQYIKDGQTTEVNGKTLKGPGSLVSNAVIIEGSTCTFGALDNCLTESFERANDMADATTEKMTVDSFAQQYPDVYKSVADTARAEGQKDAKKLFTEFQEHFKDDPAFLVEQFAKGVSLDDAIKAENAKLKQANKDMASQMAESNSEGETETVDPAAQEFSDDQANAKTEPTTQRERFDADEDGAKTQLMKICKDDETAAFQAFCDAEKAEAQTKGE